MKLLYLPFPSLTSLSLVLEQDIFQDSPESLLKFSPIIREIYISLMWGDRLSEPNFLYGWPNLCSVVCYRVSLGVDTVAHLSRLTALTELEFMLSPTFSDLDSPLSFSNLHNLRLTAQSLTSISRFLSHTRLPVLKGFQATVDNCHAKREIALFLAGLMISNSGHTVEALQLNERYCAPSKILLGLEDLQPCMPLSNLRQFQLSMKRDVVLTDGDLLTSASAWPKLELLRINEDFGWRSQVGGHGITSDGLLRLLRICPLLTQISLCLDTRGYVDVPPAHVPESLGLARRSELKVKVLDAIIETGSALAIASFFSSIAACCESHFTLCAWYDWDKTTQLPKLQEYRAYWDLVLDLIHGRPRVS